MIIWINGAFGSGKTTTAELLNSKIKISHIYDPEQVGYFLWDSFPSEMKGNGDFQDIEIWRSMNYKIIKYMYDNYKGTLIIPMTITNVDYYNQIIGKLKEDGAQVYHFILDADKEHIKHRLTCRGECENSWPEQQIDRCLQAFKTNIINGEKIDTNNLSAEQVVNIIMGKINYRKNRLFMNLKYIKAKKEDADKLIEIYNASFYDDYINYGECPAYGRTRQCMEESIEKFPKLIIYCDDIPVGVISVQNKGGGEYYIGCLCVIPKYQGKGIGTQAVKYMLDYYKDWSKITLITPTDKEENINFYTKKCGFIIEGTDMDGNVKVVHFLMER